MAMNCNKNDGFFGGDGFYGLIVLFFIFAMFGGGGLWGGNAATQGALTRAEMYEGFNTAEIQRNQNDLMRGQFDIQKDVLQNRFDAAQCCCNTQKEILESRYTTQLGFQATQAQQAQCCCDITTAIHAEAEATRALINSNTMQNLRDNAPTEFAGHRVVKVTDYQNTGETGLPSANVLIYSLEGGASVVVRPSGTEPKIKTYFTTLGKDLAEAQAQKDALTEAMRASYEASMGAPCPVTEADRAMATGLVADVTARVSSLDVLFSPAGLAALAQACLGVDAGQLLASHYPNTYIAWLDALRTEMCATM